MTDDFISPLIALLGIALSALISLLTSKKVAVNEIKKLRFEAKRTYEAKLFEERLKCYPGIFYLLSNFIKEIEFSSISLDTVKSLLIDINNWDSKNAIVLSQFSADACYGFRHHIRNLLKESPDQLNVKLASPEFLQDLRLRAAIVEFVLRSDIGIYGIKSSEEGEYDLRIVDSYEKFEEMRKSLKERDSKFKDHIRS